MIIEENNQNKQGGRNLKTVDYCLQYGKCCPLKIHRKVIVVVHVYSYQGSNWVPKSNEIKDKHLTLKPCIVMFHFKHQC